MDEYLPTRTEVRYPLTRGSYSLYGSTFEGFRESGNLVLLSYYNGRKSGDWPFSLTRTRQSGGTISGHHIEMYGEGGNIVRYSSNNYPEWFGWLTLPTPISFAESDANFSLKGINMTNPSRAKMKVLASILELRDLPKMLRLAGRVLHNPDVPRDVLKRAYGGPGAKPLSRKEANLLGDRGLDYGSQGLTSDLQAAAAANLAWQFGWAPIVSDMKKLVDFKKAVNSRRKEINRLYSGRGLKRRITLQNDMNEENGSTMIYTPYLSEPAPWKKQTETKVWLTARWKPNNPSALPPSDTDIGLALYGLSAHGVVSSAWELLPWSWLVDWFSNVGDLIDSTNNSLGAHLESCMLMKHQSTSATVASCSKIHIVDNGGYGVNSLLSFKGYESKSETKERGPAIPPSFFNLSVSLPILGSGQLSILSSLAILRMGR